MGLNMLDHLPDRASSHVITDGTGAVAYSELPAVFAGLDDLLARHGVGPHDCLAVVGKSGVQPAGALLYLLARKRPCLLWPSQVTEENGRFRTHDMPPFCDFALLAADGLYQLAVRERSRPRPRAPSAPWVYVCTSGTSGVPKIAVYRPEKLLGNACNCVNRLRLTADDRIVVPLPIAHMYGLGAAFLPAVLAGASVHLLPNANLLTFLEAEERFDPNVAFLTSSFGHMLVMGRRSSRPYRLTILGSDRIDENMFARYEKRHGCTVAIYGSTELGAVAASDPLDPFPTRRDTVGRLLGGVRLRLTEEGVLSFAHPYACAGYADDLGEPFVPADLARDGWYQTRDRGQLDDQGCLRVLGRADHCVKRDGLLVAFADVERALGRIEDIERAVVLGAETTPRGKALVACCVSRASAAPDPGVLRSACSAVLPAYAVPDRFVFLEEIPMTASGKPDRRALEALLAAQAAPDRGKPLLPD
jgi:acyl-CoA synthetase (AMP-forming)/AMP-acid ligase II